MSFKPTWASAPGETISDILAFKGASVEELARDLTLTSDGTRHLLAGSLEIDSDLAERLGRTLGPSAEFWAKRETNYRRAVATELTTWVKSLPTKDMRAYGWIEHAAGSDLAAECLRFFGAQSVSGWRASWRDLKSTAFRSSGYEPSFGAVAAWLREGEKRAEAISCAPWSVNRLRDILPDLRRLTREKSPDEFIPKLRDTCAQAGVAIVVLRAPSKCSVYGAVRFLGKTKALLQVSFRYLSDDQFWFSVFHEIGHLVLHARIGLILEGDETGNEEMEAEANEFAADTLVPNAHRSALADLVLDPRSIARFAQSIGVSPGVVLGQLQFMGIVKRNQLNGLKRRFRWEGADRVSRGKARSA